MSRNPFSESGTSPTNNMEVNKNNQGESSLERPGRNNRHKKPSPSTKRNVRRSTRGRGAQGTLDAASDEESNGDDEDSSNEQEEEEEEEPSMPSPSAHRRRDRRTGFIASNDADGELNTTAQPVSVFNDADDTDTTLGAYPRRESIRRLSNNNGFFTYTDEELLRYTHLAKESAVIDSDDDDYTGVDQVDDDSGVDESEDDEDKKDDAEAAAMLAEPELPEPLLPTDFSHTAPDSASYFREQMARMPDDHSLFLLEELTRTSELNTNPRKVRFAEGTVIHSSSSSETSEDTVDLPDLFTETSVNMHGFNFDDNDMHSPEGYANSEDGSYWDCFDDGVSTFSSPNGSFIANSSSFPLLPTLEPEEESESDEGSSSGYDTDDSGDTTDEEMPPPPRAPITPTATLRSYRPGSNKKPAFKHAGRPLRSFPIMGSFAVEKDKAIVLHRKYGTVILRKGDPRHTRLVEQSESASTAQSSPTTPFQNFNNADDSDFSEISRTPITGTGVDVMLGGLFGGASDQTYNFGGQVIGPPEAFYPFKSIGADGHLMDADDASYDEDDDEDDLMEDELDLSNFVKGLSDNEDDHDGDTDVNMSFWEDSESDAAFGLQSPAPTDTSSFFEANFPATNLYQHFSSPGMVNSFRRQQDRATRLQRVPHDPAQRVTRPIRSGYNANTLITPSRRRKPSRDEAMKKSFSSPVKNSKVQKIGNRVMGPPPRPRLPKRGFFQDANF